MKKTLLLIIIINLRVLVLNQNLNATHFKSIKSSKMV